MRFPMNTYQDEGISLGKQFQLNIITSLIRFFLINDFPSRINCNFFRTTLFLEKLFLHTFSEQPFRHNSYFFRAAAFLRSSFFRTVTFSQQLFQNSFFFRPKLLQSSLFLRIGSYLGQLLFETAIFRRMIRKKDIYRRATFSKQVLLHIINFFKAGTSAHH